MDQGVDKETSKNWWNDKNGDRQNIKQEENLTYGESNPNGSTSSQSS